MKFIALFLSIIVLALTINPCCALEGTEAHGHETMQKDKHECGEKADDCCKDCSPFYVCGTCIGFTLSVQKSISFAIPLSAVKHNTLYIPTALTLVPFSVWQPPKLS